jgi:hypothetical protein
MGPQLIVLAGRLVIVDRSCDAFDPVHAHAKRGSSICPPFAAQTPRLETDLDELVHSYL